MMNGKVFIPLQWSFGFLVELYEICGCVALVTARLFLIGASLIVGMCNFSKGIIFKTMFYHFKNFLVTKLKFPIYLDKTKNLSYTWTTVTNYFY